MEGNIEDQYRELSDKYNNLLNQHEVLLNEYNNLLNLEPEPEYTLELSPQNTNNKIKRFSSKNRNEYARIIESGLIRLGQWIVLCNGKSYICNTEREAVNDAMYYFTSTIDNPMLIDKYGSPGARLS